MVETMITQFHLNAATATEAYQNRKKDMVAANACRDRANGYCEVCGSCRDCSALHRVRKISLRWEPKNLIWLCRECRNEFIASRNEYNEEESHD